MKDPKKRESSWNKKKIGVLSSFKAAAADWRMVYSMASNFIAEAETGIIIIMQPPQFSLLFFLWHELQHKLVSFYDLVITGPEDNLTTLILGRIPWWIIANCANLGSRNQYCLISTFGQQVFGFRLSNLSNVSIKIPIFSTMCNFKPFHIWGKNPHFIQKFT